MTGQAKVDPEIEVEKLILCIGCLVSHASKVESYALCKDKREGNRK